VNGSACDADRKGFQQFCDLTKNPPTKISAAARNGPLDLSALAIIFRALPMLLGEVRLGEAQDWRSAQRGVAEWSPGSS
jgi:hypothetical protein